MESASSVTLLFRECGVNIFWEEIKMLTRRDFFRFFLIGGFLSLLRKKVKAEQKPREAMFWKRVD